MKRPVLILALGCCLLGVSWAQNMGGGTGQQLPVGQTFKNFEFPIYQDGKLKAKFIAVEAKGITQNRAETSNLTIRVYDKDVETTTITSPKADLYVNERKMRTKSTVLIVRPTQEVSAQICDFDLINKKYMLRTKVRVVLKDVNLSNSPTPAPAAPVARRPPLPRLPQRLPRRRPMICPSHDGDSHQHAASRPDHPPLQMNPFLRLPLLLALLAFAGMTRLPAQDTGLPAADTAPPGSTVITSDELRSDENTHISVFTGDVTVNGNGFNLTCDEMTVYFTKANKIDHIVCVGNVIIKQPGRVTTCGRCEYFSEDDKFVLTDGPVILDGKNRVSGPRITIYRGTQQMNVQGKGSKVTLGDGALGPAKTSASRPTP